MGGREGGKEGGRWRETEREGEDGSFSMELLKIAGRNQIRSIRIVSISVCE